MRLKDLDSIQIAPSFSIDSESRAILAVFDEYMHQYASRAESLPIYSLESLYSMTDSELSEVADSLSNLAYNKGFDRDFRVDSLWNTLSTFNTYGTIEGIKEIIKYSTPVADLQIEIITNPDDELWYLDVTASEPIPVLTADIYNNNAVFASRISQAFGGIGYTVESKLNDVRSVCGGVMGWGAYVDIVYVVGDYGEMDGFGDINRMDSPKGEIDGSILALFTNILEEEPESIYGEIDMAVEVKGYTRSSAYQGSNKSLTANSSNFLYPEGGDSFLQATVGKTYTLKGAYTNNNTPVDITGCGVSISSNNIKLEWGSTAAQVCYVIIEEV